MNRRAIIDAVVQAYKRFGTRDQVQALEQSLKQLRDVDLVEAARKCGLDIEKFLAVRS